MRSVTQQNYNHSYTFFFIISVLFHHVFCTNNTLSSTETLTLTSKKTIVSSNDVFELGFFKTTTNSTDHWYLGIWYKKIPERTYVWIANRDNPLSTSIGTLKISYNNLVLVDQSDTLVWSTNLTRAVKSQSPVMAELLSNGNFVLRDSKTKEPNRFLWQSFDFPVDTLLPGMKLGWDLRTRQNRFLTSWKSQNDLSTGHYSFQLRTGGLPEFYLMSQDFIAYRTGPWDGIRFNGLPNTQEMNYLIHKFIENREEISYTFRAISHSLYTRLTLSYTGMLMMYAWTPTEQEWAFVWMSPTDYCASYSTCSSYSYCDNNTAPSCNCIKGFALNETTSVCERKSPLSCGGGGGGGRDGFVLMENMKLPESDRVFVDRGIGLDECREKCLADCDCTGFANMDIRYGGSGCVIWTGMLADMRKYNSTGQDLYVKLGAIGSNH
ncbi:unnamed protein product [Cochlearia groenlandica]